MKQMLKPLLEKDAEGKNKEYTFDHLIERLKSIRQEKIDFSDESTLAKIEKILDKERIVLPQFVIDDIANAKKQYENGEFLSEEEAEKDFEEWLNEK